MKKDDFNFKNEAMFMLKAVFLSFLLFSIPAQSMQMGKEVTERISKFNVSLMKKFIFQQKTRDDMLIKYTSIFNGSQSKKQFSAKDMIRDDTISRLTTYATPINYDGTLLKVKKQEYNKEYKIKTPAVLQAFEHANINKLPTDVQKDYEAEDEEYNRYSQHTAEQVIKGKKEIVNLIAKNLLKDGMSIEAVALNTGLSEEQIEKINKT